MDHKDVDMQIEPPPHTPGSERTRDDPDRPEDGEKPRTGKGAKRSHLPIWQ
jgi:hypothetical protein